MESSSIAITGHFWCMESGSALQERAFACRVPITESDVSRENIRISSVQADFLPGQFST